MEKDIYEMYLNGPFDWFNPIDLATNILTGGPTGNWTSKPHKEKIFEIKQQYPNLTLRQVEDIVARQKQLRSI